MSAIWWMLIGGAAVFVAGVVYIFFRVGRSWRIHEIKGNPNVRLRH